jgi:integrase
MARKKKQRGEYGAGSTYQNKKGEWFASFPLGQGKRDVRRVASKQEGDAWRQEMKRQRDEQGVDILGAQTLFSDYAGAWLAALRKQKQSTIESYRDLLEYYILDFVEGARLCDLRMQHFKTMLQTLLDEGYAVSQIRNAINLAARILDVALADDLIPKNYAALVRKDIPANPESPGIALTVDEVRRLIAAALWRYTEDSEIIVEAGKPVPNHLVLAYTLGVLLGLRKGEVLGLRWANVNLDALTITIDQQVQYIKRNGMRVTTPKGAVRTLPITPAIAQALRALWQFQQQERLRWGLRWHEHGLVFPAENGNPKEPSIFLREYKLILKAAGLHEELRFHDLRHTAATRAGEAGMEEYVISAMLGHGKSKVTRRYAKATIEQMRRVIEDVERLYRATDLAKQA